MSQLDPGLQPERTALAWERTLLAVAGGSLVYARVAAQTIGGWSWLLAAAGIAVAGGLWWRVRRRYTYAHRALPRGTSPMPDALLPALLAGALAVAGTIMVLIAVYTWT